MLIFVYCTWAQSTILASGLVHNNNKLVRKSVSHPGDPEALALCSLALLKCKGWGRRGGKILITGLKQKKKVYSKALD